MQRNTPNRPGNSGNLGSTQPYWIATERATREETPGFAPLHADISVDVAVIGGGIAGLTAALLLKRAGKTVSVLEQHRIAGGESGHTTAHITEVIDSRYYVLESRFGEEGAKLAAESSRASIEQIERFVQELGIDCGFKRVPAFLYTERFFHLHEIRRELEAMRKAGVPAAKASPENIPLPFRTRGGIRIENQAQFHPVRYLQSLAEHVHGDGSMIYEHTRAIDIQEGEPCVIRTEHGAVRATDVFVATNTPSSNRVFLHTKLAAYRTYAIAAKVSSAPRVRGLYWDTEDPYHYAREQDGVWIIGGADHKTGMESETTECYERLAQYARDRFGDVEVLSRWSGQILEPVDGLPFIGLNSASRHLYVAAGSSGNGMTFGTLSGMIVSDLIQGNANRWAALYSPTRVKPLASAYEYVVENKDFPVCFIKDRITSGDVESVDAIPAGEGRTIRIEGKKLAVFRSREGELRACSPVCPHLGCHVRWNKAEKSWDCPCHGSRFSATGELLNGPALRGLTPVELPGAPGVSDVEEAGEDAKRRPGEAA